MSEPSPEAKQAADDWHGFNFDVERKADFAEGYAAAAAKLEKEVADLKELREGDNKLIRALAEDAGIKITAPNHMLGQQWEQFHDGVMQLAKLREELELAWGIIANAGGGDWFKESQEWQDAAAKWRDEFYAPFCGKARVKDPKDFRLTGVKYKSIDDLVRTLPKEVQDEYWRLQQSDAKQSPVTPDKHCLTTPDGDCISTDPRCMHQSITLDVNEIAHQLADEICRVYVSGTVPTENLRGIRSDIRWRIQIRLAQLVKDKARLDWLEQQSEKQTNSGLLYVPLGIKGHNLRKLIDAQMNYESQWEEEA